ncbi:hypothetical protein GC173_09600 [bacterium]|nr:hypothetical protein [bacterium]
MFPVGHTIHQGSIIVPLTPRAILCAIALALLTLAAPLRGQEVVTDYIRRFGMGTLKSAAYSPDDKFIATCSGAEAYLWDAETGEVVREFAGHTRTVESVAFSPDGTRVLTGSTDHTARLWDASTGAVLRTFTGHTYHVNSVAFSPDGTRVLTGSSDNSARLWDPSTGAVLRTFTGHTYDVSSVAFSPDGTRVLTGSSDGRARLWDASTGAELRTFTGHTSPVTSVALSPDGTRVLAGEAFGDSTARLWDANTGEQLLTLVGHSGTVSSVAFSPDGSHVLTGSSDKTARLWDARTGAELRTFSGHTNAITYVAFSPDSTQVLTGSRDGTVRWWPSGLRTPHTKAKVLIVAGGGRYLGNAIAEKTRSLAELAHLTSTIRGVPKEDILYLSAFESPGENPLVDGPATLATLQDGLRDFAGDARQLTIFLFDHGEYDPVGSEWYFYLDAASSPRQVLSASAFDTMVDEAQAEGLADLVVVVDSCYAGGFVKQCAGAPAGARRIVVASTTDDRLANFGGGPSASLSFSSFLLQALLKGVTVRSAFAEAHGVMQSLRIPRDRPQIPWLDDDGDGVYTGLDGEIASRFVLGKTVPFGAIAPELVSVAPDAQYPTRQAIPLSAEVGLGRTDGVDAIVSWSGDVYTADQPIADVTTIPLTRVGSSTTWQGTVPLAEVPGNGEYSITYVAYRRDPLADTVRYTSNPLSQQVRMVTSPADIYEFPPYNDSTQSGTANLLAVGIPQDHTIHIETDEDWGIVYDKADDLYQIEFSNLVIPAGNVLNVFVYSSIDDTNPEVYSSSLAVGGILAVTLPHDGQFVYYSARLCSVFSPIGQCLAPSTLTGPCSYRVELKSSAGGRVGGAIQIDAERMSLPIGLDGLNLSLYRGLKVWRSSAFGGPEVLVGGAGDLTISFAQTPCDCPSDRPGMGSFTSCFEVLDRLSPPPLFDFLVYRVELVLQSGSTEEDENMDATGTIVGGYTPNPIIAPFCLSTAVASREGWMLF